MYSVRVVSSGSDRNATVSSSTRNSAQPITPSSVPACGPPGNAARVHCAATSANSIAAVSSLHPRYDRRRSLDRIHSCGHPAADVPAVRTPVEHVPVERRRPESLVPFLPEISSGAESLRAAVRFSACAETGAAQADKHARRSDSATLQIRCDRPTECDCRSAFGCRHRDAE